MNLLLGVEFGQVEKNSGVQMRKSPSTLWGPGTRLIFSEKTASGDDFPRVLVWRQSQPDGA